jgi:hypothetical protein
MVTAKGCLKALNLIEHVVVVVVEQVVAVFHLLSYSELCTLNSELILIRSSHRPGDLYAQA